VQLKYDSNLQGTLRALEGFGNLSAFTEEKEDKNIQEGAGETKKIEEHFETSGVVQGETPEQGLEALAVSKNISELSKSTEKSSSTVSADPAQPSNSVVETPAQQSPNTEALATVPLDPEAPAPEAPAPEAPAPEAPAPEAPAPEAPAPEVPALQVPAPQFPLPEATAPEAPALQTQAPVPLEREPELPLLVSDSQMGLLSQWTQGSLQRIYKASRDGFGAQDFHTACDKKGATLIVVLSEHGHLFGGFTTVPWGSIENNRFGEDKNAFLFTLTNPKEVPPQTFPVGNDHAKFAMKQVMGTGPIFGGGSDLMISTDAHVQRKSYSCVSSYKFPAGFAFTSSQNFKVTDWEVFLFL
jgi:hypothetical protein